MGWTPLIIVLPLPSRDLYPNRAMRTGRGIAARRREAARQYRRRGMLAGYEAGGAMRLDAPQITARFYWRDGRHPDPDGALASIKPLVDGLVDSEMLADDKRIKWTIDATNVDRDDPRLELEIQI